MNASISRAVRKVIRAFSLAACGAAVAGPAAAAQLEEIVVTAQKREQNLLDVPLSVSVLSAQTLAATGVKSVADFEFLLPALVVAENSCGALVSTALVTRGIGVNGNIPYFEPSTALFIDGAYRSRSSLGLGDLVNIDRVEYLKGPQSTLHGRNASAGVLSVYTSRPRDEWGGFVELTGEVEDVGEQPFGFVLRGEASGPITDTLRVGVSGTYRDVDDLFEVTGSEEIDSVNGTEDYSLRAQIEFIPSDAVNLRITGGMKDRDVNGPATELLFAPDAFTGLFPLLEGVNDGLRARQGGADLGPDANALFDLLLGLGAVPTPEGITVTPPHNAIWDRKIHLNGRKFGYLEGEDVTADLAITFANGWVLNSITSFNQYDAFDSQDIDQLTMPIGRFEEKQDGEAFSQELRLTSPAGEGAFNWILGAFFLKDEMRRQVEFQLGPNAPILGVGIDGDTGRFNGGLDTDSLSIFGQVNWQATEKVEVSLGARWIDEEKDGFKINSNYNGDGPASPVFQNGGFAAIFDPDDSGDSSLSTSDTSYSLTLNYKPTESMLLYGLYSRGFKSGGFNVVWGPIGPGEPGFTFGDETVDLFEAGLKGTFLDGRLQASVSAFHQTHDDYQTAAFIGTIFNLSNAEEARTQGVEVDLAWAASESWLFTLNAALTDAQYETFTRGPCHALATPDANGFCDQSGEQLPFVAEWAASASAEYRTPLANGTLRLRADLALSDDYNPDLVLAPFLEQDGFTRVNLRAGWDNERFGLTAFINNMTDEEIVDWAGSANVVLGASGQFVIQSGRTYGLTGRVNF